MEKRQRADTSQRIPGMGIAVVERDTKYFDAGPLTFGVETRELSYEVYAQAYKDDPEKMARLEERRKVGTVPQDVGVSIHVFERAGKKKLERLRFDCFGKHPHYHHMYPEKDNHTTIKFDVAFADKTLPWALEQMRTVLPEMLEEAEAPALAKKVDKRLVEVALAQVAEVAQKAKRQLTKA